MQNIHTHWPAHQPQMFLKSTAQIYYQKKLWTNWITAAFFSRLWTSHLNSEVKYFSMWNFLIFLQFYLLQKKWGNWSMLKLIYNFFLDSIMAPLEEEVDSQWQTVFFFSFIYWETLTRGMNDYDWLIGGGRWRRMAWVKVIHTLVILSSIYSWDEYFSDFPLVCSFYKLVLPYQTN